jgi:hypothetical protein
MTRDENGRFVKGETGNPKGRPPRAREERYYEIMMTTCSYADWQKIVEKAVIDAKRGDKEARKWLSDYLVGTAEQRLDITSDGGPVTLRVIYDQGKATDTVNS